jgi:hypothetical protein
MTDLNILIKKHKKRTLTEIEKNELGIQLTRIVKYVLFKRKGTVRLKVNGRVDPAAYLDYSDLLQDLILHIWGKLEKYRPTRCKSPMNFIITVAYNELGHKIAKYKVHGGPPTVSLDLSDHPDYENE